MGWCAKRLNATKEVFIETRRCCFTKNYENANQAHSKTVINDRLSKYVVENKFSLLNYKFTTALHSKTVTY